MERRPRARLELSDQMWEVPARAGGNVAALHRHLKAAGGEVPSLASLHRVVRRDLQASRILPDRAVARREREGQRTRQALADLALAGPREGGAAKVAARRLPRLVPEATRSLLAGENGALAGVALPAGAQLVRTSSVRSVTEAVGQAMATQGALCLFGDPGRGKTAAVRMALHAVPPGWKVTWVPVSVRLSVVGMRRAVSTRWRWRAVSRTRLCWPTPRSRGLWGEDWSSKSRAAVNAGTLPRERGGPAHVRRGEDPWRSTPASAGRTSTAAARSAAPEHPRVGGEDQRSRR
ncbi:hypothetical protein ABT382_15760 [Streptomyces pharetrae]|uniref:hypothetical protein n=1 Tax=Streptomyces pharetrae TaxID=291370 RepID=UPI00336360A1